MKLESNHVIIMNPVDLKFNINYRCSAEKRKVGSLQNTFLSNIDADLQLVFVIWHASKPAPTPSFFGLVMYADMQERSGVPGAKASLLIQWVSSRI